MNQNKLREEISSTYQENRIIQQNILATKYPIHCSRLPQLRIIAKKYKDNIELLDNYQFYSYEDVMIYGLILCAKKRDVETFIHYYDRYISKLDSWCYTDSIFKGYKGFDLYLLNHYKNHLTSEKPYYVRAYLNMALEANKYLEIDLFDLCTQVKCEEYIVNMMIAWILQILLVKDYPVTLDCLKQSTFSPTICKMTLRKVKDSRCFTVDQKQHIERILIPCK